MSSSHLKIISGPALFALCLLLGDAEDIQVRMIASMLWMLAWWVTNAIPIGATALLPILLFPMLGILDLRSTTINYGNPVIYLFLGGFVLGLGIEKWNLHRRIALNIMRVSGESPNRVILGSMLATALLSMWISNTATTIMMLPIGMSVVSLLGDRITNEKASRNFGITLMLGIAYAANIGGITTLIGTPPNLVLSSILAEQNIINIGFSEWLLFAFPLVAVLFALVYFVNTRLVFPIKAGPLTGAGELISKELQQLGRMSTPEKRVGLIMLITALLWIFRGQVIHIPGLENLSDPAIAIAAAIAMFAFPAGEKQKPLLDWKDTRRLPWGILLLFGGGISLAKGMEATDIVGLVGNWISSSEFQHPLVIILIVGVFAVFLTEVMSNVALVSVFVPVSFVIAGNLGMAQTELAIPLTIAASCAFMLPISTPPNAIVFGSGYLQIQHMARTGLLLNIFCVIIITLYSWLFQDFFFSLD
jgi:sodium-dependent dicarboxylate transporter 2/3/5